MLASGARRYAATAAATATTAGNRRSLAVLVPFGGLTLFTFGLGTWQVQRYFDSLGPSEAPPVARFAAAELDWSRAVHVGPRPGPPGTRGMGFWTYVPLDASRLVNVGWTPRASPTAAAAAARGAPEEELTAKACDCESGSVFLPSAHAADQPLLWADRKELLARSGVDADAGQVFALQSRMGDYAPKPVKDAYLTSSTHVGYALTWYSLTVAGILMTRRLVKTSRR